jgi:hypothetical protein
LEVTGVQTCALPIYQLDTLLDKPALIDDHAVD